MPVSRFPILLTAVATILAISFTKIRADDTPIHSIDVGTAISVPQNDGDTWCPAWAKDDYVYTPSNDTGGFYVPTNDKGEFRAAGSGNVMFHRMGGQTPATLAYCVTINTMSDYRRATESGPDGCTWKSSGCTAVDGQLYLTVARHKYGGPSVDPKSRQPAANGSIIRSPTTGFTWVRAAQDNYDHPMFPGSRFATPYFVNYGQDGHEAIADASDRYVYATANNGFWDNGDDLVLGRVLRSKLPDLNASDWQFFKQGDGASDANWSSKMTEAQPIVSQPNHLGMTGAVYLPQRKCYFMIGWYYPMGGGKLPHASSETIWDFYTAPHPWGPWKIIGSHDFKPEGYYTPEICPKFTSTDGNQIWAFTAGDFNSGQYHLYLFPLTLH
jgi:hypothetical protein